MFSNSDDFRQEVTAYRELASTNGHRTLLTMQLSAHDAEKYGAQIASMLLPHDCLQLPFRQSKRDISDDISWLLGSEHDAIVFNATQPFDPRLLAASSGTLKAGGILILLTLHADSKDLHATARLMQRLTRFIAIESQPSEHCEQARWLTIATDTAIEFSPDTPMTDQPRAHLAERDEWHHEQQTILAGMQAWLTANPTQSHGVLVLQADRGRGKSAIAGQLITTVNWPTTRLTAAHQRATSVLQRHFAKSQRPSQALQFIPVDQALVETGKYLVVDEASNLPIATVVKLCQRYERVVLATTVHGYEGAGRGFALRFYARLNQLGITWARWCPQAPVRYRAGDPLEAFINRLFLLAQPNTGDALSIDDPSRKQVLVVNKQTQITHRRVTSAELATDESLLQAVYGLLIQAHYQTTPRDLQHLLEMDAMPLWVSVDNDRVVAVAWLAEEGPIDCSVHDDIMRQRRRLRDALLPQRLALCTNSDVPLTFRAWRIVRIAVQLPQRRQQIGSQLLAAIEREASLNGIALLGASYGSDTPTDAFWHTNKFQLVHRGFRRNPRHGLHAHCVMKSTDPKIQPWLDDAHHHASDNNEAFGGEREPESRFFNASEAPARADYVVANCSDAAIVHRFATGERSLAESAGPLKRLVEANWQGVHAPSETAAHNLLPEFTELPNGRTLPPAWLTELANLANISADDFRGQRLTKMRRWVADVAQVVNKRK